MQTHFTSNALIFFFESSRQEKMPIVIPHDNYNDARPSSTDLIYIQSGCQEGVFLLCL